MTSQPGIQIPLSRAMVGKVVTLSRTEQEEDVVVDEMMDTTVPFPTATATSHGETVTGIIALMREVRDGVETQAAVTPLL